MYFAQRFYCYVIIIDCLLISFDMLYFSTDGCINKSLTYLLKLPQRVRAEPGRQAVSGAF